MNAAELLDRAQAAREVAVLAACVLIRVGGDADAALEMLAGFEGLADAEGDELDVVTISAQAIRDAVGLGVTPQ